ncbi:MAG TPA: F0F1 ATP synthase subunit epsilon [Candidatus Methylomirabilis sp.]|nr:F0F1 ATP synthase subunit epsilon [Candidatus Methylomirabilis sp.]
MAGDSLQLIVVTPERQLLREKAVQVQLPGQRGYLGVLPGHAPLITELGIGELSYHDASGKESVHIAIISGFAEVLPDRVTVLAETAEFDKEIDLDRARRALERARARITASPTDLDWERATAALQRALVRIKVGEYAVKRRSAAVPGS